MEASFFADRASAGVDTFPHVTLHVTLLSSFWDRARPPLNLEAPALGNPHKKRAKLLFAITFPVGLPLGLDGCHIDFGGLGEELHASGPPFTSAGICA